MTKMQPPKLLTDVYRDLRDRRLLIPAAALLVALVAVPLLLRSSPPPPAEPTAIAVEPTAASPAVLTDEVGIRNYRKRLEALTKKNPFDQKFPLPELESTELESGSAVPDGGGDPETPSGGSPTDETDPDPSGTPSHSGRSTEPVEPRRAQAKLRWWTWDVDLSFGPAGAVERRDGVRPLDLLPSRRNPVVAFLGAGPIGKRATFLIPEDVTSSEGDGSCAPSKRLCYFLKLKPGEQHRLTFAPEEEGPEVTYRLKLRKINAKVIKDPSK